MLSAAEAAAALERYREELGIPASAKLSFIEKRSIELADRGEIEPVFPLPPQGEGQGEPGGEPDRGDDAPPAPGPPRYAERLCWVGKYVDRFFYWELALDSAGTLVRLRKSR